MGSLKLKNLSFWSCSDEDNHGMSFSNVSEAVLSDLTISGSIGGPVFISFSSVQIKDITISQNAGNYSSMYVSFSDLFFEGDNLLDHNSGENAGFFALDSNITLNGNTSFLYNSGPSVLSVTNSIVASQGVFQIYW